jgi:hypothetical protein
MKKNQIILADDLVFWLAQKAKEQTKIIENDQNSKLQKELAEEVLKAFLTVEAWIQLNKVPILTERELEQIKNDEFPKIIFKNDFLMEDPEFGPNKILDKILVDPPNEKIIDPDLQLVTQEKNDIKIDQEKIYQEKIDHVCGINIDSKGKCFFCGKQINQTFNEELSKVILNNPPSLIDKNPEIQNEISILSKKENNGCKRCQNIKNDNLLSYNCACCGRQIPQIKE